MKPKYRLSLIIVNDFDVLGRVTGSNYIYAIEKRVIFGWYKKVITNIVNKEKGLELLRKLKVGVI